MKATGLLCFILSIFLTSWGSETAHLPYNEEFGNKAGNTFMGVKWIPPGCKVSVNDRPCCGQDSMSPIHNNYNLGKSKGAGYPVENSIMYDKQNTYGDLLPDMYLPMDNLQHVLENHGSNFYGTANPQLGGHNMEQMNVRPAYEDMRGFLDQTIRNKLKVLGEIDEQIPNRQMYNSRQQRQMQVPMMDMMRQRYGFGLG